MAIKKTEPNRFVRMFETWKTLSVPRQLLIALLVLVACAVILSVLRAGLYGVMRTDMLSVAPSYSNGGGYASDSMMWEPAAQKSRVASTASYVTYDMAVPAEAPLPPEYEYGSGVGLYEESAYETRAYAATVKTGNLEKVCDTIEAWKPLSYVVFEQATRGERACSYRFKVQQTQSDAMLAAVQALNPTDLSASIESAKRQKVQFDGELSILLRKQTILESTLESSVAAYDELVTLSKSAEDVETLSQVIDSKLAQIERLTRERVALAGQLQQLTRQMAELEDQIEFVYFNLTIEKYEIVDGDAIVDSWVVAMRAFAYNLNHMMQSLTLGLLVNLLTFAQIVLYFLMLLVAAKYGWKGVVRFWKS